MFHPAPLFLLVYASSALAQDTEPAVEDEVAFEVIVLAEDGVPRVAGAAHIVDEAELELFEFDDIHEVLATVPGVYVRGEEGFGLRPNIGIRGANSDRSAKITLLEDGVLLGPAPYAAPAAYYFPMVTRMTAVEVFKGPAATQHGPHTVGGAVNLVTRAVPRSGPAGAADIAMGLRQTVRAHGWAATGNEPFGVLLEGTHLQTAGFKELDTGGPTGFERDEAMLKLRAYTVDLKLGFARETSNESYLGLHIDDMRRTPFRRYTASEKDRMRWHRTQAELSHEERLSNTFAIRTTAYHHFLTRAWTKLNRFSGGPALHGLLLQPDAGQNAVFLGILRGEQDSATPDQTLQIGTNDRRFHSYGIQSRARHRVRSGAIASTLEIGLRLHADDVHRRHTEDPHEMQRGALVPSASRVEVLLDQQTTALALAAHIHEDLEIGRFRVLPGLRVETVQTGVERTSEGWRSIPLPGLGLHADVIDGLSLFTGAYRGFSPVAPGQPEEVRPESSLNLEAGFRAGRGGPRAEVVGYLNDYDNLVGTCTLSGGCSGDQLDRQYTGGQALVYGIESLMGHRFLLPLDITVPLELTYTLTETQFQTGFVSGFPQFGFVDAGYALPYVPRHQGSARLSVEHPRMRFGLAATARSGMLDAAGEWPASALDVPALAQLDAALDVQATRWVEVYSTWTNATASTAVASWRPFGARPVAPMQVMFGIQVRDSARNTGGP